MDFVHHLVQHCSQKNVDSHLHHNWDLSRMPNVATLRHAIYHPLDSQTQFGAIGTCSLSTLGGEQLY